MKNTIFSGIIAIICTAAICVTFALCVPSKKAANAVTESPYITEEQAAEYIGVDMEVMLLMRDKLKTFEGAYMSYTYTNAEGKEVTELVYNKDALDDIMAKQMKDNNMLNFKYIQDTAKTK